MSKPLDRLGELRKYLLTCDQWEQRRCLRHWLAKDDFHRPIALKLAQEFAPELLQSLGKDASL